MVLVLLLTSCLTPDNIIKASLRMIIDPAGGGAKPTGGEVTEATTAGGREGPGHGGTRAGLTVKTSGL